MGCKILSFAYACYYCEKEEDNSIEDFLDVMEDFDELEFLWELIEPVELAAFVAFVVSEPFAVFADVVALVVLAASGFDCIAWAFDTYKGCFDKSLGKDCIDVVVDFDIYFVDEEVDVVL